MEVKSGKDFKKHAALNHLLDKYDYPNTYVVSLNNLEVDGKIVYLPIYMLQFVFESDKTREDTIPAL